MTDADAAATVADAAAAAADASAVVACDRDGDGVAAADCGGADCDDQDPRVFPGALERCSWQDENCTDGNNEGLDCSFLASSNNTIYRIDPFAGTCSLLTEVAVQGINQSMLDIDTAPSGQLLAITDSGLFEVGLDGSATLLSEVDTPFRTNGLAIDSLGVAFLTNQPTLTEPSAFRIDLGNGELELLGSLDPYTSSGDCVKTKDDSLLMTAPDPHDEAGSDLLVFVDSVSASPRLRGAIGYRQVWGLSASWGYLFGVTGGGEVIEIDQVTGTGTLLFSVPGAAFWGAANAD